MRFDWLGSKSIYQLIARLPRPLRVSCTCINIGGGVQQQFVAKSTTHLEQLQGQLEPLERSSKSVDAKSAIQRKKKKTEKNRQNSNASIQEER